MNLSGLLTVLVPILGAAASQASVEMGAGRLVLPDPFRPAAPILIALLLAISQQLVKWSIEASCRSEKAGLREQIADWKEMAHVRGVRSEQAMEAAETMAGATD